MALLWYLYRGICDLQQMPLEDSMRLEKGKVSLGWESEGLFNVEVDRNYGWWGGGEEWRRGLARQEEKEEDGDIYIAEYCVGLPTIQSFWEDEVLVSWILWRGSPKWYCYGYSYQVEVWCCSSPVTYAANYTPYQDTAPFRPSTWSEKNHHSATRLIHSPLILSIMIIYSLSSRGTDYLALLHAPQ